MGLEGVDRSLLANRFQELDHFGGFFGWVLFKAGETQHADFALLAFQVFLSAGRDAAAGLALGASDEFGAIDDAGPVAAENENFLVVGERGWIELFFEQGAEGGVEIRVLVEGLLNDLALVHGWASLGESIDAHCCEMVRDLPPAERASVVFCLPFRVESQKCTELLSQLVEIGGT